MAERFVELLSVGGKTNSLGRVNEVIQRVLDNQSLLSELYGCLISELYGCLNSENAWVRMRAIDALEKVCRQQPDWLLPYIDRLQLEFASSTQPSIQWHLAQLYSEVKLSPSQQKKAVEYLTKLVTTTDVDWIVASNTMTTLVKFVSAGLIPKSDVARLIKVQQNHHSKSVVKKAHKLLEGLVAES